MGAIYLILRNIPPHLNSTLHHIHLLTLFYSIDLKTIGFNKILQPIVDEIKSLETEGIRVNDKHFYGTLIALSHDNLGANMMQGMIQSFKANNFCRICLSDKKSTQTLTTEIEELIRTSVMYNLHCSRLTNGPSICFWNQGKKYIR